MERWKIPCCFGIVLVCGAAMTCLSYLRYYHHFAMDTSVAPSKEAPKMKRCASGPKNNIVFLKTHKTGSTTLQSIFYRRASKHDLFIGMPKDGSILFNENSGKGFRREFMKPPVPDPEVNMLINHMIFNYSGVSAVVPSDTFYVTLLRDPVTQFESVSHYYRSFVKAFGRISFEYFLKDPKSHFKGRSGGLWWYAKNNMLFFLGFDSLMENHAQINEAIARTEDIFDFVAIAEYFDLSLLLLKDLLCWDIDDVLYLSMNARMKSTVKSVNSDLAKKITDWNKADAMLYDHFNKTFWRRVEAHGKARLEKELEELRLKQEKLQNFCVENELLVNTKIKDPKYKMYNPPGVKMSQYRLKKEAKDNETCIELILPEMQWHSKFNCRQYHKC